MRCLNCGWENAPGVIRCIKCNIPLQGTMGAGSGQTPPETTPPSEEPVGGTIPAAKVDLPAWDEGASSTPPPATAAKKRSSCPHCNYPLASNSTTCPNCHKRIADAVPPTAQATEAGAAPIGGTIDPYRQAKGNSFTLSPMPRGNETSQPDLHFKGERIELNRNRLEPSNTSITSKVQATIKLIDGEWHIVDESSMQTTFVRASEPVKLKPGDIILMGDRKFTFNG